MAMRSAMRGSRRRRRRELECHGENCALAGARAVGADVAPHAARELPRDGEAQARAVGHAFAAATVVHVEEFLGHVGLEAAAAVADVETPVAIRDSRGELHLPTAIFLSIVEQV